MSAQGHSADPARVKDGKPDIKSLEISTSPDGIIEMEVFSQILEMDGMDEDDEDEEQFSRGIVWGFFDQAEATFEIMQQALRDGDLPTLSSRGHFLKGSSAALGVMKVQASCEKMQHYGNKRDEAAGVDLTEQQALDKIRELLVVVREQYEEASGWLRRFYDEQSQDQE